jgi:mRNA-decapping enzyme subunit 2
LFFQIELAHWFFLDFYCTQEENSIYVCGIKQFALYMFEHIPFFNHLLPNLTEILEKWRCYKMSVPTYGAILLTPDMKQCLLVQSFFAKNSWGYPKGKVNENEEPFKCAIREVYEETGFDCSQLINEHAFIEGQTSNYQYTRLYIVKNVPVETKFCPKTRNEIKDCAWFTIDELPNTRNDDGYLMDQKKIRANSFYMILPFISKLKHWIATERLARVMGNKKKQQQQQQKGGKHGGGNNKKNLVFTKAAPPNAHQQSKSPYFHNNGGEHNNHNNRNARARHKSAGDINESNSPVPNGTFYNDHMKLQNNSSTPINNTVDVVFVSSGSSSAFRATNNISNSFKKKQHLQKSSSSGKAFNGQQQQQNGHTHQQEHIKRRLFSETKENFHPLAVTAAVKPFSLECPESWKNFKFDYQKIFNSIL